MKATHVHSELLEPTKVFKKSEAGATSTDISPCRVIRFEDHFCDEPAPAGVRSIEEVVADFEKTNAQRALLEEARAALAAELQSGETATIRTLRLARGWSQAALAERLGTSQPHVARIERGGENLAIQTCRRLASVLEVDLNTIDAALQRQEHLHDERMGARGV